MSEIFPKGDRHYLCEGTPHSRNVCPGYADVTFLTNRIAIPENNDGDLGYITLSVDTET
jgi:hypothetical protein